MASLCGTIPPCDSSTRPTVLVVDDVDATRSGLAELLRLRGYEAYEARDGEEALTLLQEHPDTSVVVLDLAMPRADGFWFREQQLTDPALAHVPVVVFTGSGQREHLSELRVADVLRKPLAVDAVLKAVERHSVRTQTVTPDGLDPERPQVRAAG